jgi:hypothetical protein
MYWIRSRDVWYRMVLHSVGSARGQQLLCIKSQLVTKCNTGARTWRSPVNTVIKFRVPYKAENCLTSWVTISFSRTLLHRVSYLVTKTETKTVNHKKWFRTIYRASTSERGRLVGMWEMCMRIWLEILKVRVHSEDLSLDRKMNLKRHRMRSCGLNSYGSG